MRGLIWISILVCASVVRSQTVTPQVLNTAGKQYPAGANGVFLSDNIGETFILTQGPSSNFLVTEGFLQPFVITARINGNVIKSDVSCVGKRDGAVTVSVSSSVPNTQWKYCWVPASLCPDSSCVSVDSLQPGTYSVKVLATYTLGGVVKTDTSFAQVMTVDDLKNPCKISLYNGVTPNNDGVNDKWYIENISEFPNNKVQIYTRWGQKVFDRDGYNNKDVCWPDYADTKLVSSTYFYIIDLGDGSPLFKGWVELIRN